MFWCSRSAASPTTSSRRPCVPPVSTSRRRATASLPARSRRPCSRERSPSGVPQLGSPADPDRTVKHLHGGSNVIVPELPSDIRALKDRVGRFIEAEVYPLESRIAERGAIDGAEVDELRRKAREAGFSMLNMPSEHGGQELPML